MPLNQKLEETRDVRMIENYEKYKKFWRENFDKLHDKRN